MAVDVQSPRTAINQPEQSTLDGVLRHHLRLEPPPEQTVNSSEDVLDGSDTVAIELQKRSNRKRTFSQPPMKFGVQVSRPTVNKTTIESDNKKRSVTLRKNVSRYESPSPETADPNSEAKSVTINRMQNNLQEWDKQLKEILQKKEKNDSICSSELASRDKKLKELNEKYSSEHKLRVRTEKQKDKITVKLRDAEEHLIEHKQQMEQLQNELGQYQLAYQEAETRKMELESEVVLTTEQLENSEGMRRRLNDQVTELQGQLAIEEQRSKFCTIL